MPHYKGLAFLLVALAAVPSLLAEPEDETQYGLELLGSAPQGDFRQMTSATGVGAAFLAESLRDSGTIITTRFEYIRYPEVKDLPPGNSVRFLPSAPLSLSADTFALSGELRRQLPWAPVRSVFVLGGLGGRYLEFRSTYRKPGFDQNGTALRTIETIKYRTSLKLSYTVGVGYNFNRRTFLTLRYQATPVDGALLGTLQGGLAVRF
jgi:hypothetical protein